LFPLSPLLRRNQALLCYFVAGRTPPSRLQADWLQMLMVLLRMPDI
jgi:hypothetical protein